MNNEPANPKQSIWIINHYACPDGFGAHTRQHFIARILVNNGYKVTVFTSSNNHLLEKIFVVDGDYRKEQFDGIDYIFIRTRPYKGNGLNRLLNFVDFSYRLNKLYKKLGESPKILWVSSPQPLEIINAVKIKKHFGCKFIFEERDIWPLTFTELNGINKYHPVILLFRHLQLLAYRVCDAIVSPLDNLKQYVLESGYNKEVYVVPQPLTKFEVDNSDICVDLPNDKTIIGYVGSLGKSNSVMNLIKAANILNTAKDFFFLIVGNGEQYDEIKSYCKEHNLSNIHLTGKVNKVKAISLMKKCDILYCGNPEIDLYTYGVASIKITEYLWCEKPVIHATNAKKDIVVQANAGLVIKPEDEHELVKAICNLAENHELRCLLSQNGKQFVEENYNVMAISKLILSVINKTLSPTTST